MSQTLNLLKCLTDEMFCFKCEEYSMDFGVSDVTLDN